MWTELSPCGLGVISKRETGDEKQSFFYAERRKVGGENYSEKTAGEGEELRKTWAYSQGEEAEWKLRRGGGAGASGLKPVGGKPFADWLGHALNDCREYQSTKKARNTWTGRGQTVIRVTALWQMRVERSLHHRLNYKNIIINNLSNVTIRNIIINI